MEKFVSENLSNLLPQWLIHFLWFLYEDMDGARQGSRQVFALTKTEGGQRIRYVQDHPPCEKEIHMPCPDAATATVLIVYDGIKLRMMLAEEHAN